MSRFKKGVIHVAASLCPPVEDGRNQKKPSPHTMVTFHIRVFMAMSMRCKTHFHGKFPHLSGLSCPSRRPIRGSCSTLICCVARQGRRILSASMAKNHDSSG